MYSEAIKAEIKNEITVKTKDFWLKAEFIKEEN